MQVLNRIEPNSAAAYLFATSLVALSAIVRLLLDPVGADVLPLLTFYPAMLFAAFLGGFWPGVYAATLGGIVGWWAFLMPYYQFLPLTAGAAASLVIYSATSLVIVWGADHHRSLIKQLRDEEIFRQMVVQELGHRLKNKVATIQAIIGYQLRDKPELREAISRRLDALSATDELVMTAQGQGAHLDDIVATEIGPYERSRSAVDGPRIMLSPKLALSMALVFHELATNAAKHGALSSTTGRISVRWRLSNNPTGGNPSAPDTLLVEWAESGGPLVSPPASHGFGLKLLAVALKGFDGTMDLNFEQSGFGCRMALPIRPETFPQREQEQAAFLLSEQSERSLTTGHEFVT